MIDLGCWRFNSREPTDRLYAELIFLSYYNFSKKYGYIFEFYTPIAFRSYKVIFGPYPESFSYVGY